MIFNISKFEILFNSGEGPSENCQYIWLLLGDFATSNFKIWTLKKILNIKIKLWWTREMSRDIFHSRWFLKMQIQIFLNHNEGFSGKQYSFISGDLWASKYNLSITILNAFQRNMNVNFRVSYLEILPNHAKPEEILNRYLKSIDKPR